MSIKDPTIVEWAAVLIALLSLVISLLSLARGKRSELFLLRQRVVLEAERARSAWYSLRHENDTLVHGVSMNQSLRPELKDIALEFLRGQREHLDSSIRDSCTLADDVQKNAESFSQTKCEKYLRLIEPSLEKLTRNHGVIERKLNELIESSNQS